MMSNGRGGSMRVWPMVRECGVTVAAVCLSVLSWFVSIVYPSYLWFILGMCGLPLVMAKAVFFFRLGKVCSSIVFTIVFWQFIPFLILLGLGDAYGGGLDAFGALVTGLFLGLVLGPVAGTIAGTRNAERREAGNKKGIP